MYSICRNIMQNRILLCIVVGFTMSVVFFLCFKNTFITTIERLCVNHVEILEDIEINHADLLMDIIRIRGMQILFIFFFALSKKRNVYLYIFVTIMSFVLPLQCYSFLYLFGIKGFLLFGAMEFPHGMIYILILCYVMYKMGNMGNNYQRNKIERKDNKVLRFASFLFETAFLWSSIILAILVECFCNPPVVKLVSKIIF